MRAVTGICVLFFVSIAWAGPEHATDETTAFAPAADGERIGDLSGNGVNADFKPKCTCCDLAYMDSFKGNQLLYARTPEFLEAVGIVASGESRYSPKVVDDLPYARWRAFAAEMRRHSGAHASEAVGPSSPAVSSDVGTGAEGLNALRDSNCMIPALIYLASLEYRSRSGQAGLKPIYPRVLRAAAAEVDARLAEKRRMAKEFAKRADAIRSMIARAEQTLARGLSLADELARAKSELQAACRDALGVRASMAETNAAFARAEKLALGLSAR